MLAERFPLQGVKIASFQLCFTWRNVVVLELLVLHDDLFLLVFYKIPTLSTFPHTFFFHVLIILLPPATQVREIGAAIKVQFLVSQSLLKSELIIGLDALSAACK